MFRSAATKIAHNSTLPALAGNKDLRPLQELITAEKAVLQSLHRLSTDLMKSSDCLRHWGSGEGDDLQDTLAASTTLLGYVASALSQLATHEQTIREQMKAVRTREENLDDLRRRRKAVVAKADTAERKLSKMNPEHKSLQQQTELLNNLRDQIRNLDWEILSDEAKLGDFKRTTAKNWMMLKFGGLLECAEKATIVSEIGKRVIEEIPFSITQPGQAREFYTGHEKTERLVAEAQRCVAEVVFDPQPVSPSNAAKSPFADVHASTVNGLPSNFSVVDPAAYVQDMNDGSGLELGKGTDEFGGLSDRHGSRGYGTMPVPMPNGPFQSQFSTFPVHKASLSGAAITAPPPAQGLGFQPIDEGQSSSFAAEVADALAFAEKDVALPTTIKNNQDGPAPSYEPHTWNTSMTPNGLPKGAAPPVERNPWDSVQPPLPPRAEYDNATNASSSFPSLLPPAPVHQDDGHESEGETLLPYASLPKSPPQLPPTTGAHHVHFSDANGHVPEAHSLPNHERVPSPELSDDEEARNAAAAREVAREMDALTFNPPPGPPPGFTGIRAPSPLIPPAPPFVQQQQQVLAPAPSYGDSLSSRSGGVFSGSRPDLRGPSLNPISDIPQTMSNASPLPDPGHPTLPSLSMTIDSPLPSYSASPSNASPAYVAPPELPATQVLRTSSPAASSSSPVTLTPGARTISAAAFKRTMRSPSGSGPSDTGTGGRPLPEVTPLALRKKSASGSGLPGSPYPGKPEGYNIQQDQRAGRSNESGGRTAQDYDSSYDFIASYGEPVSGSPPQQTYVHQDGENRGSPGYGRGKFATNLESEGRR